LKAGHFAQVNNRRIPMNDTQANQPVTASLVASNRRLTFLPTYFGPRLMMRGESLVYAWLRRLSEDYNGGFWNYYELSNGGFYLAPELTGRLCLEVDGNGYSGELSADAAGIVATLFALGPARGRQPGHGRGGCADRPLPLPARLRTRPRRGWPRSSAAID
jgi:hypothetical protein